MKIEKEKFQQANELISLTHQMSNQELKLFYLACTIREENELKFTLSFKDVVNRLKIVNGGNQYKSIEAALVNIVRSSVLCLDNGEEVVAKAIVEARMNKKTKDVTFIFSEEFMPYLEFIKDKQYTWIFLDQIARLNLAYSPRIYEFCKMKLGSNLHKLKFVWYLRDLRKFLNIEKKYEVWSDLNKRVIIPSQKEINEKCSDIYFTYKPLRNKAVYAIEMTIYSSKSLYESEQNIIEIELEKEKEEQMNLFEDFDEDIKQFNWWETNP